MEEFAREIIAELLKTDIEVLKELRETWIEEVKRQGLTGIAVRFCEVALELVIQKKEKKGCSRMSYEVINEKLKIASCSVSDLTLEHTVEILRGWREKEGTDIPIGELIVFFEKETGYLVINRDNAHFQMFLDIAEAYMGANKETRIKVRERAQCEIGRSVASVFDVMENCLIHRKVERHMFLIENQTDTMSVIRCRVLMKILEKWDPYIAVVRAFYYGVMIGKHEERARRKKREGK